MVAGQDLPQFNLDNSFALCEDTIEKMACMCGICAASKPSRKIKPDGTGERMRTL